MWYMPTDLADIFHRGLVAALANPLSTEGLRSCVPQTRQSRATRRSVSGPSLFASSK